VCNVRKPNEEFSYHQIKHVRRVNRRCNLCSLQRRIAKASQSSTIKFKASGEDWEHHVDGRGAFWRCGTIKFYETDDNWRRLVDDEERIYWSNTQLGIRFFETIENTQLRVDDEERIYWNTC